MRSAVHLAVKQQPLEVWWLTFCSSCCLSGTSYPPCTDPWTPLTSHTLAAGLCCWAAQEVERAIFDALLEAGADVDLQEDQGLTPVMLAVRKLSKQKAQWLIGG